MKNKLLFTTATYLVLTIFFLHADEMGSADYVDKFYKEWSAPKEQAIDGAGFSMARFYHDVPPASQAEVLSQILHRAVAAQPKNYGVMGRVFTCLRNFGAGLTLTSQTNSDLASLAADSNWATRRDVMQVLGKLKRAKDHDVIVAALNDSQDEVRGAALDAMRSQPDAETTYQKFIQAHQNDPTYRTSVLYAKSGIDVLHARATN